MYTSGSTGTPKGVVGTHGGAGEPGCVLRRRTSRSGSGGAGVQRASLSFDAGVLELALGPLLAGERVVLADAAQARTRRRWPG